MSVIPLLESRVADFILIAEKYDNTFRRVFCDACGHRHLAKYVVLSAVAGASSPELDDLFLNYSQQHQENTSCKKCPEFISNVPPLTVADEAKIQKCRSTIFKLNQYFTIFLYTTNFDMLSCKKHCVDKMVFDCMNIMFAFYCHLFMILENENGHCEQRPEDLAYALRSSDSLRCFYDRGLLCRDCYEMCDPGSSLPRDFVHMLEPTYHTFKFGRRTPPPR